MPWRASILYAQATPRLRAVLADDPVLGPELCHLQRLDHRWPPGIARHGLPAALSSPSPHSARPTTSATASPSPWDALHGPGGPALHFPAPTALPASIRACGRRPPPFAI